MNNEEVNRSGELSKVEETASELIKLGDFIEQQAPAPEAAKASPAPSENQSDDDLGRALANAAVFARAARTAQLEAPQLEAASGSEAHQRPIATLGPQMRFRKVTRTSRSHSLPGRCKLSC